MVLRRFRNRIYKRWNPTNKIFFWLAIISIVSSSIYFIIPLFSFKEKIEIIPEKILIAKDSKNYSPPFFVQNNTNEIIHQIWMKLILSSDKISLKSDEIKLIYISDKIRTSLRVPIRNSSETYNVADYFLYLASMDSMGRQVFYVFIPYLSPEEKLQFQISNNCTYRVQGEHFFDAYILNSSEEPVEIYSGEESLEVVQSPIGETHTPFKIENMVTVKKNR
ncbi:MAG: hypothetical protein JXR61_00675 [Prolixibacteraceae bacterium]|nr:hypothetical protein [Prolixibacteraceae bacterium]